MKKVYTAREFSRLLRANGYDYVRCNGDHMIYKSPNGRTISYNVRGRGLNRMVAQRLIKEYGLIA